MNDEQKAKHIGKETRTMAKTDYNMKVGDRVEIPFTDSTNSRLCDTKWADTPRKATGTVVGWNNKEQPVIMIDEGSVGGSSDAKLYHQYVDSKLCSDPTKRRFWYLCSPAAGKKIDAKGDEKFREERKIARQQLASEVLTQMDAADYAYGGYVRDHIAGKEYTDLNIFVPGGNVNSLIEKLKSAGFKVEAQGYLKDVQGKDIATRPLYSATKNGYEVKLNFFCGNGAATSPIAMDQADADINMLKMSKDGTITSLHPEVAVAEVLEKIKKGIYKEFSTITEDRRKRMSERGFNNKTTKTTKKKENKVMSDTTEKPSFMEMVKGDATKAAYRVAGTQMSKGVKQGILKLMQAKGLDDGKLAAVSELLETEIGTAIVAAILGVGLNYVPKLSEDPRVQKLGEEFRVQAMTTVGNEVIGAAIEHFLPAITSALSSLPPVENQARVLAPGEEAEEEAAPKTATA
jgi:hypothetical protein